MLSKFCSERQNVDAKPNENNVKPGDAYMSLDTKSKAVFYEVEVVEEKQGATWLKLAGMQFQDSIYIPLLFLDKSFVRVNESTIKALFGERKRDGNASKETGHPQGPVKSIRREGERRGAPRSPTSLRQNVVKTGKGHRP